MDEQDNQPDPTHIADQAVDEEPDDGSIYSEAAERKIFDHLPDGFQTRCTKAAVRIASGKDDNVSKGELCYLVRENPGLACSDGFQVSRADRSGENGSSKSKAPPVMGAWFAEGHQR